MLKVLNGMTGILLLAALVIFVTQISSDEPLITAILECDAEYHTECYAFHACVDQHVERLGPPND